jgi:hypothetical protein
MAMSKFGDYVFFFFFLLVTILPEIKGEFCFYEAERCRHLIDIVKMFKLLMVGIYAPGYVN